jgi:hypothetical protein
MQQYSIFDLSVIDANIIYLRTNRTSFIIQVDNIVDFVLNSFPTFFIFLPLSEKYWYEFLVISFIEFYQVGVSTTKSAVNAPYATFFNVI